VARRVVSGPLARPGLTAPIVTGRAGGGDAVPSVTTVAVAGRFCVTGPDSGFATGPDSGFPTGPDSGFPTGPDSGFQTAPGIPPLR